MESNPFVNNRYHTFLQTLRLIRKARVGADETFPQEGFGRERIFFFHGVHVFLLFTPRVVFS